MVRSLMGRGGVTERSWGVGRTPGRTLLEAEGSEQAPPHSSDSGAMAAKLSSASPVLNWIGAELAMRLETLNIPRLVAFRACPNKEADYERGTDIPKEVVGIKIHRFDGEARLIQLATAWFGPQTLGLGGNIHHQGLQSTLTAAAEENKGYPLGGCGF